MADDNGGEGRIRPELVERVGEKRRELLKAALGVAAYSAPVLASFSMEGLRIGTAEAGVLPPGLAVANQRARAFDPDNPPGPPFSSNQSPPGPPIP